MRCVLLKCAAGGALLAGLLPCAAALDDHPSVRRAFDLPPSAELTYDLTVQQRGFGLTGKSVVTWRAGEGKYFVGAESRVSLLGKITENRSTGTIDEFGLAPAEFYDKRIRKDPNTAIFDREQKVLRFANSTQTYPLKGGEQDRASVSWQLAAVARAAGARFKPGSQWPFFVAGRRDADTWVFKVVKREKIQTPMGELDTVHVARHVPSDARGQELDIWLAPAQEWYPVRLRFKDDGKDFVEQTIEKIVKK